MNTGEQFELEVYQALQKELAEGKLGLDPAGSKIFRHKGYYSRDRQREIIVDIAIEVYPAGYTQPAIVWVWECKDYSGAVPVDDVEEFHAKLEQIGADNTKGTMVSRGVFQKAALSYAIAKGIGMARFVPDKNIIMSHPITARGMFLAAAIYDSIAKGAASTELRKLLSEDLSEALCNPEFKSWSRRFYGMTSSGLLELSGHLDQFMLMELRSAHAVPGDNVQLMPNQPPISLDSLKILDE